MKNLLIGLIILVSTESCRKPSTCSDVPISTPTSMVGNPLRIDGYYVGDPRLDYKGDTGVTLYILYRNGTMLFSGHTGSNCDDYIISLANSIDQIRKSKSSWGNFHIADTGLKIENWVPSICGCPAQLKNGKIINDTAFILYNQQRKDPDGSTSNLKLYQEFHFRKFNIKPDSTNPYVN